MMGQVHGKIDLEAKGGKLYGFINALRKHGVLCQNQRCCGDVFYCRTETREKQLLEELAKQYHVTLQLHERKTLRFWLVRNRFRFGIPIGLLLAAAFLFYTSNVVMKIEIQGNQTVTEEEILTVLAQEGVERGCWMPSLRYAHCERQLQIKLSPLCWAAMRHTGNRLVVEVREATEKPEMYLDRQPCNLVAAKPAQIVDLSIRDGQVMRLIGDAVQEGELLVSGILADDKGHTTLHHASGSVIGEYQETQTFFCSYAQSIRTKTGRCKENQSLNFFSCSIPIGKEQNPYADYNCQVTENFFSLFGMELPISLVHTDYEEYESMQLTFTPEEAQQDLQEQMERYETNFLQETEILNRETNVTESEDCAVLTVTYTLRGEIGMQQELLVPDRPQPVVPGTTTEGS
mgnify:FL=1